MKFTFRLPHTYSATRGAPRLPKKGIEEAHRAVLNRLRKFNGASIADLALHLLWNPPKGSQEELKTFPWLSLLIVKWALQDRMVYLRIGPPIPPQEFDHLRNELWELANSTLVKDAQNFWLTLRTLLHVQLEFQRPHARGFMRWPALYARLNPASHNRQQFRLAMGMEPDEFIDLGYALYSAVLADRMPLASTWLDSLRPTYGEAVDRIFALFSRDLHQLRAELRADAAQRIRGRQELFEFPYFCHYPLLRLPDGRMHCWHPVVFARGLENAVHLKLSRLGDEYTREFSQVFERYVTEVALESGMNYLLEDQYWKAAGGGAPAVEVILEGEDCNVFVEAKMSLFQDDVLLQDDEVAIFNKTKALRKAIWQGWKVGGVLRSPDSPFGQRFVKPKDFLLVVTSRELLVGGGKALERLYGARNTVGAPGAQAMEHMPLSNVFVISIEDFERTMRCVANGNVSLSKLLTEAAHANEHPESARLLFSDFLRDYTREWSQSALMAEAQAATEGRIQRILGA